MSLSKIKEFKLPKAQYEQYSTNSELAAGILWKIYLDGNCGKVIADLGCGTGVLGLGALLLGAKKVFFVDIDIDALNIASENHKALEKKFHKKLNAEFINCNVKTFNKKVDVVLQNPPFGVQNVHADKLFLEKAMGIADIIYSVHKIESKEFVERLTKKNDFVVEEITSLDLPLMSTLPFHTRRKHIVKVGLWKIGRFKK